MNGGCRNNGVDCLLANIDTRCGYDDDDGLYQIFICEGRRGNLDIINGRVCAVAPIFFELLAVVIGTLELNRALVGWIRPTEVKKQVLNDDYFPGDVGFDPLGLKPSDPEEFLELHTKELQNGRLAMLGAAGIVAQELVNGKEIFVNLGLAEDRFDPSTLPFQF